MRSRLRNGRRKRRPSLAKRPYAPLAVMTDVLRPMRAWMPRLLPEQRDVLEAAAGGVGEASTDRLLLASATLALLATVAEDTPVLLVLDDATGPIRPRAAR